MEKKGIGIAGMQNLNLKEPNDLHQQLEKLAFHIILVNKKKYALLNTNYTHSLAG